MSLIVTWIENSVRSYQRDDERRNCRNNTCVFIHSTHCLIFFFFFDKSLSPLLYYLNRFSFLFCILIIKRKPKAWKRRVKMRLVSNKKEKVPFYCKNASRERSSHVEDSAQTDAVLVRAHCPTHASHLLLESSTSQIEAIKASRTWRFAPNFKIRSTLLVTILSLVANHRAMNERLYTIIFLTIIFLSSWKFILCN